MEDNASGQSDNLIRHLFLVFGYATWPSKPRPHTHCFTTMWFSLGYKEMWNGRWDPVTLLHPLLLLIKLNHFNHALIVWSNDHVINRHDDQDLFSATRILNVVSALNWRKATTVPGPARWVSFLEVIFDLQTTRKGLIRNFYLTGWAVCFRRRERIRLGGEKALWYCPLDNNDCNDNNDSNDDSNDSNNNEAVEQLASWNNPTAGTSLV